MGDTSNQADRSNVANITQSKLTIEKQLLLIIISVLLITVIGQVVTGLWLIYALSLAILLVIACYWLFIIIKRVFTLKTANSANDICISAAFGSFLFGLTAVLLSSSSDKYSGYTIIGIVTSACSLILFVTSVNRESQTTSVNFLVQEDKIDVVNGKGKQGRIIDPPRPKPISTPQIIHPPMPSVGFPFSPPAKAPNEVDTKSKQRQLDIKPLPNFDALPSLFERDPLYTLPQPKTIQLFVQTKSNGPQTRCEDAFALSVDETHFALSDGVSNSSFPRAWATLLARQWVKEPFYVLDANSFHDWHGKARRNFEVWVYKNWLPAINARNIAYRLQAASKEDASQRIEEGSAATLLGISLDKEKHEWRVMGIGDTCVIIGKRDGNHTRLTLLPIRSSDGFNGIPHSINTQSDDVAALHPFFCSEQGNFSQGDFFLMATDKLAAWIYTQIEHKNPAWMDLLDLADPEQFVKFVDEQRYRGVLEDDDTSLVVIKL